MIAVLERVWSRLAARLIPPAAVTVPAEPAAYDWIRVVGAQGSDTFWWVCDRCPDVSDRQPDPSTAYGLAVGHAIWHREDEHVVGWGGPTLPCRPEQVR